MSKENLWSQQLSMQLEKTNRLLSVLVRLDLERLGGDKGTTKMEKVDLLDSFGLTTSEIAEILSISPNQVSVYKNMLAKKRQKDGKKEANTTEENIDPTV